MQIRRVPIGFGDVRLSFFGAITKDYGAYKEIRIDPSPFEEAFEKFDAAVLAGDFSTHKPTSLERLQAKRQFVRSLFVSRKWVVGDNDRRPSNWCMARLDLGDGLKKYVLHAQALESAGMLAAMDQFLLTQPNEHDAATFLAALGAGRGEIMGELPPDPDARLGKQARSRAAKARQRKAAKVEARHEMIVAAFQEHLNANNKNSRTHARRLAAEQLGISMRTVERTTKNLQRQ